MRKQFHYVYSIYRKNGVFALGGQSITDSTASILARLEADIHELNDIQSAADDGFGHVTLTISHMDRK